MFYGVINPQTTKQEWVWGGCARAGDGTGDFHRRKRIEVYSVSRIAFWFQYQSYSRNEAFIQHLKGKPSKWEKMFLGREEAIDAFLGDEDDGDETEIIED